MFDNPRNLPNGQAPTAGINAGKPKPEVLMPKPGEEPEDMFAGVNTGGITEPARVMPQIKPEYNRGSGFKKIILILLIIVLVAGAVYAGYFIYSKYFSAQPINNNVNISNEDLNITNENVNENLNIDNENLNVNAPTDYTNLNLNQAPPAVDTDADGLSDVEEITLGTNPNNPDTDNDELFDREELYIYNTNPLNPDTDGDGYLDGAEVKNNYNPNGPGTLSTLPQ